MDAPRCASFTAREDDLRRRRDDADRDDLHSALLGDRGGQVDELIDVINLGGDGDRYLVWLDDLTVDSKENPRAKTYGKFKASGHSGSSNFSNVANFLEDIQSHKFSDVFNEPADPEGALSQKDEGLMLIAAICFGWSRATVERYRA